MITHVTLATYGIVTVICLIVVVAIYGSQRS